MEVRWVGVEPPKLGPQHTAVGMIFSVLLGNVSHFLSPPFIFSTFIMSQQILYISVVHYLVEHWCFDFSMHATDLHLLLTYAGVCTTLCHTSLLVLMFFFSFSGGRAF